MHFLLQPWNSNARKSAVQRKRGLRCTKEITSSLDGHISLIIKYTMRLKPMSLDWNSFVTAKKTSVASFCSQPSTDNQSPTTHSKCTINSLPELLVFHQPQFSCILAIMRVFFYEHWANEESSMLYTRKPKTKSVDKDPNLRERLALVDQVQQLCDDLLKHLFPIAT